MGYPGYPGRFYQGLFADHQERVCPLRTTTGARASPCSRRIRLSRAPRCSPGTVTRRYSLHHLDRPSEVYDFEVDDVHLMAGGGLYTSNSRRGALMLMLDDDHPRRRGVHPQSSAPRARSNTRQPPPFVFPINSCKLSRMMQTGTLSGKER